jgi:hypothetical protein
MSSEVPMVLQELYGQIDGMNESIGVAKQARLRAVVNHAYRLGKLDKINLQELAAMPVKKIHLEKKNL